MMRADVKQPPFEFEDARRIPDITYSFDGAPTGAVDNSGAAAPLLTQKPTFSLTTGASGINKTQEYFNSRQSAIGFQDCYNEIADATTSGFWRRIHVLDCIVHLVGTAGSLSATSYAGIELGSYGAVPPDPATTVDNVVRLVIEADTLDWYLIVHKGDNASAASKTKLTGVNKAVAGRGQKVRLFYNPGQWVRAFVDSVMGAEVSSGLPVLAPTTPGTTSAGMLVTSGSASANVRAAFLGLRHQTRF